MKPCTPEIRRDHNGQVDEVCVDAPHSFHLERMGTHSWWMRIDCGDSAVVVNFTARSMPLIEVEKARKKT